MHLGLLAVDGDVSVEREHLNLLLHGDLEVILAVAVEVAERGVAEAADAGDLAAADAVAPRELHHAGHELLALVEHDGIRLLALLVQQRHFHRILRFNKPQAAAPPASSAPAPPA